ncbi:MAG TPA: sulfite exporter TauE/SafE family protein [Terracidiphilus sp.]|nr:sulfite exporter TauE/SafE family protein [Terracidiphilus sp.]
MRYIIGFFIALFIALTGVGAGTITVPVLVLFLGVPAPVAVGIGLTFSAAVKLILAPAQIARRNVAYRTLGYMLLGGVPGVLVGSLLLRHLVSTGSTNLLNAVLGAILVSTASWQLFYSFRPMRQNSATPDRSPWLSWLMFPVGAEVGFSSAGAGALGSAALLSLTPLEPAQVVGTDIVFGFLVSLIGSGAHWFTHASNPELLLQLILGGVAGAIGGTLLSTHIPRRPLRFALWVWLLILGGQFLFNSYQVWASPSTHKGAVPVVHGPSAPKNAPRG